MKNFTLAILFSLTSLAAHAETSQIKVKCSGLSENKQQIIKAETNAAADALELTIHTVGEKSSPFDTHSFPIASSSGTFPIASITAREDARPRDGDLSEIYLAINNELVRGPGSTYSSTLTVSSTYYDRREGKEVTSTLKFAFSCMMDINP